MNNVTVGRWRIH